MDDLISRQEAIDALNEVDDGASISTAITVIEGLSSAQPEQAEYMGDTKAVPDDCDMVCLSEHVTATYYDDEYEEWSQKTVTIRELLDSVCDEYTVLPSAQPKIIRCKECKHSYEWTYTDGTKSLSCDATHDDFGYCADVAPYHYCGYAERRTDG